jgi:hypothetical protein
MTSQIVIKETQFLVSFVLNVKVQQCTVLDRPWGFQVVEASRFQDNRHSNVVRLSSLLTGRFYPQEIFLVLISVGGRVDPRDIVRLEGLCQWKIPVKPSGMEPATSRLVPQYPTLRIQNTLTIWGTELVFSQPRVVCKIVGRNWT